MRRTERAMPRCHAPDRRQIYIRAPLRHRCWSRFRPFLTTTTGRASSVALLLHCAAITGANHEV
jgi:hypothetical protein